MEPTRDAVRYPYTYQRGVMRIVLMSFVLLLSASAAAAVEDPVEYRVKCQINPVAKGDLETVMARGLRLFVESIGISAAPNTILVRLVPERSNNAVRELRRSDLASQWSVGPNGALVFNESGNNHCTMKYTVVVRSRVNGLKVGGKLPSQVEIAGSYIRVLTPTQRLGIKQIGRRRA